MVAAASIGIHLHPARTERAEMQPEGGGAGTAVETERNRACGGVCPVQPRVSDVKDRGARRAVRLENRQHARFGHILHRLAGDGDGVRREDRLVGCIGDGCGVIFSGITLGGGCIGRG